MNLSRSFADAGEPVIVIRFSKPEDKDKILAFYKDYKHKHVESRDSSILEDKINSARVFMAEDKAGTLSTASVAYDFVTPGASHREKATWIEIGSTRSVLQGVGLYPFIVSTQVIYEFLRNPPQDKFIAAVYKDNQPVVDMLHKKVGWKYFTPDKILADTTDLTPDLPKLHCLEATSDCLPNMARIVLDHIRRGETQGLLNKKTGQYVKLDLCEFALANELRPMLEELAEGKFGKMLETSAALPLGQTRAMLTAHMNPPVRGAKPAGP